jgi:phage minor structural protein
VVKKEVSFKNYLSGKNYAGFRYGVNLDNIQRTYGSKDIVTKLVVKANSNEYATNGFCTIARANSNPTGETSIFDFRYYQDVGLMDARQFLENAYTTSGALGEDMAVYLDAEI